jgi:hypothetical protein
MAVFRKFYKLKIEFLFRWEIQQYIKNIIKDTLLKMEKKNKYGRVILKRIFYV